jgi:hypothetical protein
MCKGITCPHDGINEDAADEIERLREMVNSIANAQDGWGRVPRLEAEIERLREWKEVANMFGECFRMDEFGQSPVSDGQDVFQATLAWERLRTKEGRE